MFYETMCENPEFSIISKENLESSDSQSLNNNSFISKFISSGSYSESSSLDISNSKHDSIVVKKVFQDYDGILDGLEESSQIKPIEKDRLSLALTTAKTSLVDDCKKSVKKSQELLHNNAFAVPGKFFCRSCYKETTSQIRFLPLELSFWKSITKLFNANQCCVEKLECPDIVHECPECHSVLAKISAL